MGVHGLISVSLGVLDGKTFKIYNNCLVYNARKLHTISYFKTRLTNLESYSVYFHLRPGKPETIIQ